MKINRDDFLQAVGQHAPPLFQAAVSRALSDAGPVISIDVAGGAIAAALCADRRFGDLGSKSLAGCELSFNGTSVWLTADQCVMHPGLGEWIRPCLAQAFMLPAELAATLAHATCVEVPNIQTVGILTGEGHCSGQMVLAFASGAIATVVYGQRFTGSHFSTTAHVIAGDSLFAIGDELREADKADEMAAALEERLVGAHGVVLH